MATLGARCGDEAERLKSESASTGLCQTSEFYTAIGASSCTETEYESSTSSIQDQGDESLHCLQNLHDHVRSDFEIEIDASKVHWSELSSDSSLDGEAESNREIFERLRKRPEYSWLFGTIFSDVEMGPKIAEGGQAEIFQGSVKSSMTGGSFEARCVFKVFKAGFSLQDLQRQWPQGVVKGWSLKDGSLGFNHWSYVSRVGSIWGGVVLEDDRFAFVLAREEIDLRKFIDVYQDKDSFSWGIQTKTLEDFRTFHPQRCTYEWDEGKGGLNALGIMYDIALGMRSLHRCNILHRDLKASNVLISDGYIPGEGNTELADGWKMVRPIRVVVADFECSIGVVGTGFWRAPEILRQLKEKKKKVHFTCEADVYSFAMTCYEVFTGGIPFEEYSWTDYDVVLSGVRPILPKALPIWIKNLIERCWHPCPIKRPTFKDIVEEIEEHIKNNNCYRFRNTIDEKEHRHRATVHTFISQHFE